MSAEERLVALVDTLIGEAIARERLRCLSLVKHRWTFDSNQQHTHNWHAMADTLAAIQDGTEAPKMPNKPRSPERPR